tara:strand:- start:181972 stop:185052 length:3081 start_codon:yes stop_codon:yes gene_type:complete
MQNKGVIRLFAIVFALACLYQLSFTFISASVNSDAEDYANGVAEKKQAYLDSMSNQVVYDIFITDFKYSEVKEKEINLGLDLKGGMNVILEVSVKDILKNLAKENTEHPLFIQALNKADELDADGQEDYLTFFLESFESIKAEQNSSVKLSDPQIFGTKEMNEILGFGAEDEAVKKELASKIDAAVKNVYTVLRARIDQFGVVQPNIQRLDNAGRILVELPGVKDPDRVKKLLQSTAQLEFWNLYQGAEFLNFMSQANEKLKTIVENPNRVSDSIKAAKAENTAELDNDDLAGIKAIDEDLASSSQDSLGLAINDSSAVDSSSLADRFDPLLSIFGLNYDYDAQQTRLGPIIGFAEARNMKKIDEYLNHPRVRALLTGTYRYTRFLWTSKPDESNYHYLVAAIGNRSGKAPLGGDVVTDARQDFNQNNQAYVSMSMNAQGAKKWAAITKEASSQEPKRHVAVVLDSLVYSYPVVNGEIPNGQTSIEGQFTVQEAQDLANILKAGSLPAPAKIIQSDVVGPSLGEKAITAGLWSFIIALAIVMIYMVFYYSAAGSASVVALIVNMFFVFGVLASIGAVLTLPGIAGIVLTIGMAVDANVLIYERIREELTHGKGLKLAITDGYKNAYSSIIDANVTTFLTGVILYVFGTGPIRGFATTLIIGILTSLFCAIFITRLIFEWRMSKGGTVSFATSITKNAFKNFTIDFLSKKKIAYGISGLIIAAGIVSLATRGLNQGVDFVGGRSYQIKFDQNVVPADIQADLGNLFLDEDNNKVVPQVKTIGDESQVIITTKYKIAETGVEVENDIKSKLYEGTKSYFKDPIALAAFSSEAGQAEIGIVSERQVGPTIADDIKKSAVLAIIGSLIVIFLYILIRFSRWQFSLGAVAAAFHDVLVVLAIFSIFYGVLPFSLEIDQAFIAAILTVIGYSLNDTVVVFDRIREYLGLKSKKTPMKQVVNEALNSTLSRTINTSVTTFFVLLVIFVFGGEVIRGFMFALLIGVVVGTYSSLFIATPLMMDSLSKLEKREEE